MALREIDPGEALALRAILLIEADQSAIDLPRIQTIAAQAQAPGGEVAIVAVGVHFVIEMPKLAPGLGLTCRHRPPRRRASPWCHRSRRDSLRSAADTGIDANSRSLVV